MDRARIEVGPLEAPRLAWLDTARPEQVTPPGDDWRVWLYLAGRGAGKTRAASEDAAWYGLTRPRSRIAVVAETFADGRDVCVEGESGLLSVLPRAAVSHWNRSLGELVLVNGTRYRIYSGDKPDGLRGPQFHRAWVDELAKYRYARETWTQLQLALRLGENPQAIVTTTPRPISLIREMMSWPETHLTRGSTYDNAPNLAPGFLEEVRRRYEGTRIGRQELYGEYLDDVPGALWSRAVLEAARTSAAPDLARVVVAIDPAVTSGEGADETGIVVAGRGVDGLAYVLADYSCRLSPDGWARRAMAAFERHEADLVVAEINQGGDLVERVIRTVAPNAPYKAVRASRGKVVRAEPVAALYEQRRVRHAGSFPELEDQMVSFLPEGGESSPDRVDALVYAVTELMLQAPARRAVRVIR